MPAHPAGLADLPGTVDNYVRRIDAKLPVNTLGGAVARAIRDRIV